MSNAKPRLGKGLEALIPKTFITAGKTITSIPLALIERNPYQPRRTFDKEELASLTQSVKKYGVNQPILVRRVDEKYELIAGERRFRASINAGLETIPAIVKNVSDLESLQLALIENIEREDLNPIEEAFGYYRLMQEFKLTQQEVSSAFGKSRSLVANRLRLLQLPENIRAALISGEITEGHARTLLAIPDKVEQQREFVHIKTGKVNVRELESRAAKSKAVKGPAPSQMALFADLEKELSTTYESKIKISGSQKKGKIIIPFNSESQLEGILEKLKSH